MIRLDTCIIIKNEKDNVAKLIPQLLQFSDEIHFTDTGSTDGTLEVLQSFQNEHENVFIHHFDWVDDFSAARNYSLYCYEDTDTSDYKFWCDADDLLTDELIKKLQEFKTQELENMTDCYMIEYLYAKDFFQTRIPIINTKKHFTWHDAIHEFLAVDGENYDEDIQYFVRSRNEYLVHQRVHVHTDRNLHIFFSMLNKNTTFTARNYFYFATELMNHAYPHLAIPMFMNCIYHKDVNYLDKINAGVSLYKIFKIYPNLKEDFKQICDIKKVLLYMYDNQFVRADIYNAIGDIYFDEGKKVLAEQFYHKALDELDCHIMLSFLYDHKMAAITCLLQLSLIEYYDFHNKQKSFEYNKKLNELYPDCEQAINNMKIIASELVQEQKQNESK